MRLIRNVALGAASLALVLGACTSGGGSSPSPSVATTPPSSPPSEEPSGSAPAGPSIASTFVLAGPPECPERPFCLLGLEETYGLEFKEFRPTDAGGPITVQALIGGDAQVGLLFTSDPAIQTNGFVLLEDDQGLQLADNLVPVLRQEVLDASPVVADLLNGVTAKLSQTELTELNTAVTVDAQNPADVAAAWIDEQGLGEGPGGGSGSITVGSTNFYEQEILAEIYAQVLEDNGFTVERKFQLGNREVVFPALESGEIDILAEYAATVLEFVNEGAGEATADAAETVEKLKTALEPLGLTALDAAEATDQNGFVVTQETADEFGLATISDLAKPAP